MPHSPVKTSELIKLSVFSKNPQPAIGPIVSSGRNKIIGRPTFWQFMVRGKHCNPSYFRKPLHKTLFCP